MGRFCGQSASAICKQITLITGEMQYSLLRHNLGENWKKTPSGMELQDAISLGLFSASAKSLLYNKPLRL